MKGEEKARKQNRCYYGADGKVQKTPIAGDAPQAAAESGGRRPLKSSSAAAQVVVAAGR